MALIKQVIYLSPHTHTHRHSLLLILTSHVNQPTLLCCSWSCIASEQLSIMCDFPSLDAMLFLRVFRNPSQYILGVLCCEQPGPHLQEVKSLTALCTLGSKSNADSGNAQLISRLKCFQSYTLFTLSKQSIRCSQKIVFAAYLCVDLSIINCHCLAFNAWMTECSYCT